MDLNASVHQICVAYGHAPKGGQEELLNILAEVCNEAAKETRLSLDAQPKFVDITAPEAVEVLVRSDGKVVWVNVDGACAFRACKIGKIELVDERIPVGARIITMLRKKLADKSDP